MCVCVYLCASDLPKGLVNTLRICTEFLLWLPGSPLMCSCTRRIGEEKKQSSKNILSQRESWNKTENKCLHGSFASNFYYDYRKWKHQEISPLFNYSKQWGWKSLQHKVKHPLNDYIKPCSGYFTRFKLYSFIFSLNLSKLFYLENLDLEDLEIRT